MHSKKVGGSSDVGAEAYAITTNAFFATYAGTRASLPFLDVTIGVRDTWSYAHSFLPGGGLLNALQADS